MKMLFAKNQQKMAHRKNRKRTVGSLSALLLAVCFLAGTVMKVSASEPGFIYLPEDPEPEIIYLPSDDETPSTGSSSSYQVYYTDGSWEEAWNACLRQGGHLAYIETAKELKEITSFLDERGYQGTRLYIGAFRELYDSNYYWHEDVKDPINALNASNAWCRYVWLSGEPTYRDETINAVEHVVEMFYSTTEKRWVWNDIPNELPKYLPDDAKVAYLIEFENNNRPKNSGEELRLPESFYFASGVGGWDTELFINSDYTFYGNYHDSDADQIYYCDFYGAFTKPVKKDRYTWSMRMKELVQEGTEGTVFYRDGMKYIYSTPYGLEGGNEFLIYLPGTPETVLSEEMRYWSHVDWDIYDALPADCFCLYNVKMDTGFVGYLG